MTYQPWSHYKRGESNFWTVERYDMADAAGVITGELGDRTPSLMKTLDSWLSILARDSSLLKLCEHAQTAESRAFWGWHIAK